jgi:hypothetical protein
MSGENRLESWIGTDSTNSIFFYQYILSKRCDKINSHSFNQLFIKPVALKTALIKLNRLNVYVAFNQEWIGLGHVETINKVAVVLEIDYYLPKKFSNHRFTKNKQFTYFGLCIPQNDQMNIWSQCWIFFPTEEVKAYALLDPKIHPDSWNWEQSHSDRSGNPNETIESLILTE